jgi:hypothetical protein
MKKLILMLCMIGLSAAASSQNVTPAMKLSNDLAVVVNAKNATSEISTAELGLILSGERKFWGGKAPVQLVLMQPGMREFDEPVSKLLKMKPQHFKEYWKSKVFRGEAQSEPTYVPSSGMAAQFSRDLRGAVTLLAARDLPPDAKVLKVDGKYPGEAGYPLR